MQPTGINDVKVRFTWMDNPGFKKWASRVYGSRPLAVHYDGYGDKVYSTDARLIKWFRLIRERLTEQLPQSEIKNGLLTYPYCSGDWLRATCHLAGYLQDPMGIPLMNASKWAKRQDREKEDQLLLKAVANAFVSKVDLDNSFYISKVSSSGVPYFTTDPEIKRKELIRGAEMYFPFGRALLRDDRKTLTELANEGMCGISHTTYRSQTDKVSLENGVYSSKLREVESFDRGWIDASKSHGLSGLPDFFAMRGRVNNGMAAKITYPGAVIAGAHRIPGTTGDYAPTWHAVSQEEIEKVLSKYKYIVGVDTSQFERSVTDNDLRVITDCYPVPEEIKAVMYMTMSSPALIKNDALGGRGWKLSGDVRFAQSYSRDAGLPSGDPKTSDIGKIKGTTDMITLLNQLRPNFVRPGDVPEFLSHGYKDAAVLSLGDDGVFGMNDKSLYDDVIQYLKTDQHPYATLESEMYVKYAGMIIGREGDQVVAVPDATSYIANWFAAERGIDSLGRKDHYMDGWHARREFFSTSPAATRAMEITDAAWKEIFKSDISAGLGNSSVALGLSNVDKLFLEKPQGHHYGLYNLEDVSDSVKESFALRISPEDAAEIYRVITKMS